jgi:hypothetical protein
MISAFLENHPGGKAVRFSMSPAFMVNSTLRRSDLLRTAESTISCRALARTVGSEIGQFGSVAKIGGSQR